MWRGTGRDFLEETIELNLKGGREGRCAAKQGAGGRCFCFWRLWEAEASVQGVMLCPVWESSEAKGSWEVSAVGQQAVD